MATSHPRPRMLLADDKGQIYDDPDLLMLCRKGNEWTLPRPDELMPLPPESELFLLLQPLFTFIVLYLAGCTGTALAVGTVVAAMPTGTMVYVLGERYRACPTEASMTVIVSTILSLITLPLVMLAMQWGGIV